MMKMKAHSHFPNWHTTAGVLSVRLVSGADLMACDALTGDADPFAIISVGPHTQRSSVVTAPAVRPFND